MKYENIKRLFSCMADKLIIRGIISVIPLFYFPTAASVDSLDWKDLNTQDIVTRVIKRVKPGSVMLFHNGAKNTPAALPQIIEKLQQDGYKFVTATELLLPEPTIINHQGTQTAAEQTPVPEKSPET